MSKNKINIALKLLIILIGILIIASNYINLGAFLSNGADLVNFCFSSVYIVIWLLILILAKKSQSKTIFMLYLIFWLIESIYFGLYMIVLDTPLAGLWYIGVIILFMPIIGAEYPYSFIEDALQLGLLYDFIIIPFLLISFIMFTAGYLIYIKVRLQLR